MKHSPEQVYTELLRQLANPAGTAPEVLANMFRDVERMHSTGQITDWQLQNAREAYARTPGSKMAEPRTEPGTRGGKVSTPVLIWLATAPRRQSPRTRCAIPYERS